MSSYLKTRRLPSRWLANVTSVVVLKFTAALPPRGRIARQPAGKVSVTR